MAQNPTVRRFLHALRRYAGPQAEEQDKLRIAIPLFIAVASIGSAFVGWRATEHSSTAGELDRRASQALIRQRQIIAEQDGSLTQDLRLFAHYQEHVLMRRLLERDAARVRSQDRRLAADLAAEAEAERAAARSMLPLLFWHNPGSGDERGTVTYDRRSAQQRIDAHYSDELAALRAEPLADEANRERDTAVNLFGVAALFVASLFFLTLAQLGRAVTREIYAASGMIVLVAATLLFHWVGP